MFFGPVDWSACRLVRFIHCLMILLSSYDVTFLWACSHLHTLVAEIWIFRIMETLEDDNAEHSVCCGCF
uniref:Uncharacterized protein n=1 Tax=Arundo donax TaxID=35708 RepID=A0A0A9H9W3_ARUDO